MKYIKFGIIIVITIIVCGCSKEYKLYIDDSGITEKFHMEIDSSDEYIFLLDGDFYPLHNNFDDKYKKDLKTRGNNKVLNLEYKYSFASFINANSFNQCFDYRNIKNEKEYYTIDLAKPNGCMFNTNYTINIITDNEVVENNANSVKGNKYIWYVDNAKSASFKLLIKIKKGTSKTIIEKYSFIAYIVVGSFAIGILLLVLFFIKKYRQNKVA